MSNETSNNDTEQAATVTPMEKAYTTLHGMLFAEINGGEPKRQTKAVAALRRLQKVVDFLRS